jgi:hypothetical protein
MEVGHAEAELTASRPDRKPSDVVRDVDPRTVEVELRVAEPVRDPLSAHRNQLGSENVGVEAVRGLPVRDGHHCMVEAEPGAPPRDLTQPTRAP